MTLTKRALFVLMIIFFLPQASAQVGEVSSKSAPPATTAVDHRAALFKESSTLSGEEQIERASDYIQDMKENLRKVLSLYETARDEKDVVKLNCVNEKLTAIKGLLRVAELADITLQEMVAKREKETAAHEFTKIAIARDKVRQLAAEAEGCAGQMSHYMGDTKVELIQDPNIPPEDPTEILPPEPIIERPISASQLY